MSYFRDNIDKMPPYVPGEQPPPGTKVIKLNTNENPYPPSPKALAVLGGFDAELLRRYSDPNSRAFCAAAGKALDVPADWILAGNGSDDTLAMVVLACAGPRRKVVYPMPTYVLYRTLAQMQDAPIVEVPYDDDYTLPADRLIAENGAVTFIARPNSPSGTCPPLADVERLARGVSGLVGVDEAYVDFADDNALGLARRCDNVVVLRTLSKAFALAGARCGAMIAQPEIVQLLQRIIQPYAITQLTIEAVFAALRPENAGVARERVATLIRERERLAAGLARSALVSRVWPSAANFMLLEFADAGAALERTHAAGLLVRDFRRTPGLERALRISVGTPEQNDRLLASLS